MITGDWLEDATRLRVAGHVTTTVMIIDLRASRAMNARSVERPLSAGYFFGSSPNMRKRACEFWL